MLQRSDSDLWRYHAYVYAFRRVMLKVNDSVSPVDPEGIWYKPEMVTKAERHYRAKFAKPVQFSALDSKTERDAAASREQFALDHGYDSFVAVMKVGILRVASAHSSPENRKALWQQKMFAEVRRRLPDEQATTLIQGYIQGEADAVAFIETVDADVKAQRVRA